jgi:hypothetical protein
VLQVDAAQAAGSTKWMARIGIESRVSRTLCRLSGRPWKRGLPPAILILSAVAALAFPPVRPTSAEAQALPPQAHWNSFRSEHFRVTFPPELEPLARHAAERAELAYRALAKDLIAPPPGAIDLVVTDHVDFVNGFASPFPGNLIVLNAIPPVGSTELGFYDDWLALVVDHELTHIVHMDATGRGGALLRHIFGRVPSAWPLFPDIGVPAWNVEGLAVDFESRLTGYGRINGSYYEMVLRTALLEGRFDPIDRACSYSPIWPGAPRHYIYGSLFMDYISRTYGRDVEKRIVRRTAGAVIPPPLAFDRIGRSTIRRSFTDAWSEWEGDLTAQYARLADSLQAEGLTETEEITHSGYVAAFPRVAPDGQSLVYAGTDGRNETATWEVNLGDGSTRALSRRNTIGPSSYSSKDDLIYSQVEFMDPYHVYQDLYRVRKGQGEQRLTEGARLQDPDVSRDGRHVVSVENGGGGNRLILYNLQTRTLRPLTDRSPDGQWSLPRWSPDGLRLAATRRESGRLDLVILDTLGVVISGLTHEHGLAAAPTWSPDGLYVLFSSDRTGIPNLYAASVSDRSADTTGSLPALYQITNLLTGAFQPDVSPDGCWIYFSLYHADGFHIARIPYQPTSWRSVTPSPPPHESTYSDGPAPTGQPTSPVRTYSSFPTLRPRYWVPTALGNNITGYYVGAFTSGEDVISRHSYSAWGAYAPSSHRVQGEVAYAYAGLGRPILGLQADRSWDAWDSHLVEGDTSFRVIEREDDVYLGASLVRRRWRSSGGLSLFGELVERTRTIEKGPVSLLHKPHDRLLGVLGSLSWSNVRRHAFSIGAEDGLSVRLAGRRRWDQSPASRPEKSYWEGLGYLSLYRGFPLFGFARHVLAGSFRGLWRTGPGSGSSGIGGPSGGAVDLVVTSVGGSSSPLPLRGFAYGVLRGSRAWTSSAEYRFPLLLIGRGYHVRPIFVDRVSASAFVDAGDAWCLYSDGVYRHCGAAVGSSGGNAIHSPLIGVGGEIVIDFELLFSLPLRLRGGLGFPVRGPATGAQAYVAVGSSF